MINLLNEIRNKVYIINNLIRTTYTWGIGGKVNATDRIHLSAASAEAAVNMEHAKNSILFADLIEPHFVLQTHEEIFPESPHLPVDNCIINKVMIYIHNHYMEHITLVDLAQQVYIHPGYLSTLFKETTGKNFSNYLMEYRISKAKEYLRDSVMKVSEVGRMVGYEDPAYFTKI